MLEAFPGHLGGVPGRLLGRRFGDLLKENLKISRQNPEDMFGRLPLGSLWESSKILKGMPGEMPGAFSGDFPGKPLGEFPEACRGSLASL